jgi:hypothetical protein
MKPTLFMALLALAACDDSIPGLCESDIDCAPPAYCYSGICVFDFDGGVSDGGTDATADASDGERRDGSAPVEDSGTPDGNLSPTIARFTAEPSSTITRGETAALSWEVSGATGLAIDNGVGAVSGSSIAVAPTSTTKYILTATNAAGRTTTASLTVTVVELPTIISFSAVPAAITSGQSSTLSWSVFGATAITIDQDIGTPTGTSVAIAPTSSRTYTLTATNSVGGTATAAVQVTVVAKPVISSFGAAPATIFPGASALLSWSVTGASTLSIDHGVGAAPGNNTLVTPSAATTYLLTAQNSLGYTTTHLQL